MHGNNCLLWKNTPNFEKNIYDSENIDLKESIFPNQFSYLKKFDQTFERYKDYFSKKSGNIKANLVALTVNPKKISEKKQKFIEVVLPLIILQNQKI